MAEKQEIIIEVEIDNKAAQKNAAELNKKLFEQREKLKTTIGIVTGKQL